MATLGETSRPGFVYDSATDTWIPVGIGPHSHTPAAIGAISSSVVTTKGDIIAATGSGTVVRQGVGADGSFLMADSSQTDGLNYAGPLFAAGKNFVANGGMDVWQRGVGPFTVNNSLIYVTDRWFLYNASVSSPTAQRVAGTNTGTQYAIRLTGASSFTNGNFAQRIESNQIAPLAGKTVTFSGKIYGSATVTGFNFYAIYPSAQDNYSSTTSIISGAAITVNTTLNTFSVTFALPSGVINGLEVGINLGSGLASGVTVDISSLQLEQGSAATPFARAGGSIGGELALCQRYYTRFNASGGYSPISTIFFANTSTNAYPTLPLAVPMRGNITSVDWGGNMSLFDGVNRLTTITSITANSSVNNLAIITITMPSSMTTLRAYRLDDNGAGTAYIGFSAEL